MVSKGRSLLAGLIYTALLAWEVVWNVQMGTFSALDMYLNMLIRNPGRMLFRSGIMWSLVCLVTSALLAQGALRQALGRRMKGVCTLLYVAGVAMPYAINWPLFAKMLDRGIPQGMLIALVRAAAALIASFVILRGDALPAKGAEGENGYYADLYRQGLISRKDYEDMTSGKQ